MTAVSLSLYVLGTLILVNLLLTLRLVAWARRRTSTASLAENWLPELAVGATGPTFRARFLDGRRIDERTYAGREVAYVFLSPNCDGCTRTLPQLQKFYGAAAARGTEIVVVTDTGPRQTSSWLEEMTADGTPLRTPVVAAPHSESAFIKVYNGPLLFPYFCVVGTDGTVRARGLVGRDAWMEQVEVWAGRTAGVPADVS
ncbi:redoxin domain-containing protein [Cryptosporangium minutisporangium]|uniref:Thioredoxin domain-containing protein n=1 Tax=Cryptosporangium minutisporangium TaxID=113569 RepID=A0ABP6T0W4_9ACTN